MCLRICDSVSRSPRPHPVTLGQFPNPARQANPRPGSRLTTAVKVNVEWPSSSWLLPMGNVYSDCNLARILRPSGYLGIPLFRALGRWTCPVRIKPRVNLPQHSEIDRLVWGVGDVCVVELDELGVELVQQLGVDRV